MAKFVVKMLNPLKTFILGISITPVGYMLLDGDKSKYVPTGGTSINVWFGWVLITINTREVQRF